MKKRCTNPACRRSFSTEQAAATLACPHCGKPYPRLGSVGIALCGCTTTKGIRLAYHMRYALGYRIREAKERVRTLESNPLVLGPMSRKDAQEAYHTWTKCGAVVRFLNPSEIPAAHVNHSCAVVLTGHRPAGKEAAIRAVFRETQNEKLARDVVAKLPRREYVLRGQLPQAEADALAAQLKADGVLAHVRWQKTKEKPPV